MMEYVSYSLNFLKGGYIGDYIGDYYRGYEGGTRGLDSSSCRHRERICESFSSNST